MVRDTSTSRENHEAEESGPPIQISKSAWEHERIARRAYELYEQRGGRRGCAGLVGSAAATAPCNRYVLS